MCMFMRVHIKWASYLIKYYIKIRKKTLKTIQYRILNWQNRHGINSMQLFLYYEPCEHTKYEQILIANNIG